MNVGEVLDKVGDINALIHTWRSGNLNADHFDDMMHLIIEYKDELLKKKVV